MVLAEVRSHYIERLKELERKADSPFAILTEEEGMPIRQAPVRLVLGVLALVVGPQHGSSASREATWVGVPIVPRKPEHEGGV